MIQADNAYEIGYLSRTHGLKGELILIMDVNDTDEYADIEVVYILQKNKYMPFFVEALRPKNHKEWIVKFEDIDNIEAATPIAKSKLYLSTEDLPQLDADGFYFHEIIGYTILDNNLGEIGKVSDVLEANDQYLLQFYNQNHECLLPLVDAFVLQVNKETKVVHTELPDGLLEIYTQK